MPRARDRHLAAHIRKQLKRDTADLVEFASELIRIPSENPPGLAYARCATLIARRLRELGLAVRTHDPTGDGPCVTGTFGAEGRALYFSGHYDVVPAQSRGQFEPEVRKRNLHGRGAADMKGGVAAMAFAIRALATSGFEPKGRLVSVSVPDEETSGPRGTVALASKGIIERDAIGMFTMEPTSGVIWNANRGVVSMRVTVRGKPAHVGLHFKGVNAFRGGLRVANEFASLERKVSRRKTRHHVTPAAARNSILLMGGELSGGHNFNVVPDLVSFTLDRRTNPEEDFDLERERLLEIVRDADRHGIRADAEIFQEGRSGVTQSSTPLARALVAGIGEASGSRPRFELCPGVLETRHYQAIGVPALAFGPGLLSVSHGPNEFVSIPKMVECAEAYALAAARLL